MRECLDCGRRSGDQLDQDDVCATCQRARDERRHADLMATLRDIVCAGGER